MSDEGLIESIDRRLEEGFRDLRHRVEAVQLHFDAKLEVLQTHAVSTDHNVGGINRHLGEINGTVAKNSARLAMIEEAQELEKRKVAEAAAFRAGQMAWRERWRYRWTRFWAGITSATGRVIIIGLMAAFGFGAAVERAMEWWK